MAKPHRICITCKTRWRQFGEYCSTCRPPDYIARKIEEMRAEHAVPVLAPVVDLTKPIRTIQIGQYEFDVMWDGSR